MQHPKKIEKYSGTNKELVEDILKMDYSSITEIFNYLIEGFQEQSNEDRKRISFNDSSKNRTQLANKLEELSQSLIIPKIKLESITKLCKKYMKE